MEQLGNQHGHYAGFTAAGAQLQRQAEQVRVGLLIGTLEVFDKLLSLGPNLRRDFGQPNGCFDGFDLAKEGADTLEWVAPPMLKKPCSFRRNLPVIWIGKATPGIYVISDLVDDRIWIVFLIVTGQAICCIKL